MPVLVITRHPHPLSERARKRAVKANRHSGATRQSFSGQTAALDHFHSALCSGNRAALAKIIAAHAPDVRFGSLADMTPLDYSVRPTPAAGSRKIDNRRFRSTIVRRADQCRRCGIAVLLLNSGRSVRQLLQLGTDSYEEFAGNDAALFAIKVLRAVNGDRRNVRNVSGCRSTRRPKVQLPLRQTALADPI